MRKYLKFSQKCKCFRENSVISQEFTFWETNFCRLLFLSKVVLNLRRKIPTEKFELKNKIIFPPQRLNIEERGENLLQNDI